MFTGLIEETGFVKDLKKRGDGIELCIRAKTVLEGLRVGDSVCVNGICLTAETFDSDSFSVFCSSETLKTAKPFEKSSEVNLERALTLSDRLGGHIVSGHVDSVAVVRSVEKSSVSSTLTFSASADVVAGIVKKGSIAVDGVSLTIADVSGYTFKICVIPETLEKTTLKNLRKGSKVNIETDMLGKYVEKFLKNSSLRGNFDFLGKEPFV